MTSAERGPPGATRVWAVVPAAGIGRRMGRQAPKQYLALHGRPVIDHSLAPLVGHPRISRVCVALRADDPQWQHSGFASHSKVMTTSGGPERAHSVLNGLDALAAQAAPEDWVLVHDAARPCLLRADLDRLLELAVGHPVGGLLAVPVSDSVKQVDGQGRVCATLDRAAIWRALTPQLFRLETLREALASALSVGLVVTDESQAMERAGHSPRVVQGHGSNIKITRSEDLALASFFLQQRGQAA